MVILRILLAFTLFAFMCFWGVTGRNYDVLVSICGILFIIYTFMCINFKKSFIRNITNSIFFMFIGLSLLVLFFFITGYHYNSVMLSGALCAVGGTILLILSTKYKKD